VSDGRALGMKARIILQGCMQKREKDLWKGDVFLAKNMQDTGISDTLRV